jgi:hypothetical protein
VSIAEVGSDSERDEETRIVTKTTRRLGHSCPETHTRRKRGRIWPTVACLSAKQGLGIYCRVRVRSDTLYATQREREGDGGKEVKIEIESPAGDRSRGVVCERSRVFRMKGANERNIEARQRARGRKER